jgi:hypothetical protein
LGVSRELANEAWAAAIGEQTRADCALIEIGSRALAKALAADKPPSCWPGTAITPIRVRPRNPAARSSPAWVCK